MSCEIIWIERKIDMINCGIIGIELINFYICIFNLENILKGVNIIIIY